MRVLDKNQDKQVSYQDFEKALSVYTINEEQVMASGSDSGDRLIREGKYNYLRTKGEVDHERLWKLQNTYIPSNYEKKKEEEAKLK